MTMTAQHDSDVLAIDLNAVVNENIKALVARRGDNQVILGHKLGLSTNAVSLKFRLHRQWSINDVAKVAAIYDVAPWSLFEPVRYEKGPNLREVGADLPIQYTARDSNPEPTDLASLQVIDMHSWVRRAA